MCRAEYPLPCPSFFLANPGPLEGYPREGSLPSSVARYPDSAQNCFVPRVAQNPTKGGGLGTGYL
jgi:hypothetical protein